MRLNNTHLQGMNDSAVIYCTDQGGNGWMGRLKFLIKIAVTHTTQRSEMLLSCAMLSR